MLRACADRQWAGLSDGQRAALTVAWEEDHLTVTGRLSVSHIAQKERPIWSVAYPLGHALTILSVKSDYLGDLP